jgi:hypothetical protein
VGDAGGQRRRARKRAARALAQALEHGKGVVHVLGPLGDAGASADERDGFSTKRACPSCGTSFPGTRSAPVLVQLQARLVRELLRHRAEDRAASTSRAPTGE